MFALPSAVAPARPSARIANPEAYERYLTAHYLRDRGEFRRAVLHAQQAVAADPNLALAHAELAAALTYQDTPFTDPERRARADAASQRAVELDPTTPQVHALRARIVRELGSRDEAGAEMMPVRGHDPLSPRGRSMPVEVSAHDAADEPMLSCLLDAVAKTTQPD